MKKVLKLGMFLLLGLILVQYSFGDPNKLILRQDWWLQASEQIKGTGAELSQPGFKSQGWYSTSVPNSVLAVLTEHKVYTDDPYFGKNLRKIPGNFPKPYDTSSSPRTPFSPFRKSWWYRTEFEVPASWQGRKIWLNFKSLNFRADIWFNGQKIGDKSQVAGPFRIFEFDITELAKPGKTNALAVEIFPPGSRDLSYTWVDWNPAPPDRNMGILGEVYLSQSGPIALRFPNVITDLELPSLEMAHLTVSAELKNATEQSQTAILKGGIGEIKFSQEVKLSPKETKIVFFKPEQFPQLNIKSPRLWWPAPLGPQNLYQLNLQVEVSGEVSDQTIVKFGIRKVTAEFTKPEPTPLKKPVGLSRASINDPALLFRINGQRILIRGAGWAPDLMLRYNPERLETEIRYVKEMNLNTIRLEGKLEFDEFYEICDREGILVMPGWCCCDQWEKWHRWDEEDYRVSEASLRDQCKRLRNHPSVFVWLNGSDNPPVEKVERTYLKVLEECQWQNPVVSNATAQPGPVSGPSGVKMTGPYEWVPPVYWYEDKMNGGAFGFNTETSPGPAVPPIESLRQMLGEAHLWPIDDWWNYHAGRGLFGNLKVFTTALNNRYGSARSAEEYALKAQAMAYESHRAMFEAYARNKYLSTGVIQWMLNTAWPGMIWHLYDYYLRPGGSYFATKKACEPVHIQYSYDDHTVYVVNSLYQDLGELKARVRVFNFDLSEKFNKELNILVPADSSIKVLDLSGLKSLSTTYFIKLELFDRGGKLLSSNFYWLSTKPDTLNWALTQWHYTPQKDYADYQALNKLPKVELNLSSEFNKKDTEGIVKAWVENPGLNLAFLIRLKLTRGKGGEEILPIFWEDNYFSLLPGEKREIIGRFYLKDLRDAEPVLEVDGWNVLKKYEE